jgi:hypothetical protein
LCPWQLRGRCCGWRTRGRCNPSSCHPRLTGSARWQSCHTEKIIICYLVTSIWNLKKFYQQNNSKELTRESELIMLEDSENLNIIDWTTHLMIFSRKRSLDKSCWLI